MASKLCLEGLLFLGGLITWAISEIPLHGWQPTETHPVGPRQNTSPKRSRAEHEHGSQSKSSELGYAALNQVQKARPAIGRRSSTSPQPIRTWEVAANVGRWEPKTWINSLQTAVSARRPGVNGGEAGPRRVTAPPRGHPEALRPTGGQPVGVNLRLVGFDNIPYASLLTIPMTTMDQPCRDIAITAFNALRERLAHPTLPPRNLMVTPRLVVRESCGAYLHSAR